MQNHMDLDRSPDGLFVEGKHLGIKRISKKTITLGASVMIVCMATFMSSLHSRGQDTTLDPSKESKKKYSPGEKTAAASPPSLDKEGQKNDSKNQYVGSKENQDLTPSSNQKEAKTLSELRLEEQKKAESDALKDEAEFKRELRRYHHKRLMAKLERRDAGLTSSMEVRGGTTSLEATVKNEGDTLDHSLLAENDPNDSFLEKAGTFGSEKDSFSRDSSSKDLPSVKNLSSSSEHQILSNYLPHKKVGPLSPYEVKQGTVIPGVMISGINSDLPGQIIGQVSQTVFDTATGEIPLIPQGSRLVGTYDSVIAVGQEGAMIAWKRIIFPDATSIDLLGMSGTDQGGYSGFRDQVNNHYLKIFGSAFMLSLVGAGYQISQPQDNGRHFPRNQDILAAEVGRQFAQVSNELIRRNMQIQPTIEIRPGYRFHIMVNKDIILEPYVEENQMKEGL